MSRPSGPAGASGSEDPAGPAPRRPALPDHVDVPGLEVRTWRASDAPELGAVISANLEHLRPFLPWVAQEPLELAGRLSLIDEWERARLAGESVVYGILDDDRIIGGTGAHGNRTNAPDGIEIGYWLSADVEGRGLMTRVVAALTEVLLAHPGITHVEIRMDEANVRSAAVPARCGYRLVDHELREATAPGETGRGLVWRIGPDPRG